MPVSGSAVRDNAAPSTPFWAALKVEFYDRYL